MYFDKLDLNLWKNVQDKFSEQVGLPIYTVDREGNEVSISGEHAFLIDLIKNKNPVLIKDRNYRQLSEIEDISIYNCYGSIKIIKPVFLHDKKIGAIICGPVKTSEYDYSILASKLGIDESELVDAAKEITNHSSEKIELYKKLISILAEILPKLAHQKQSKDKQISELTALYSIIKMVNSTLELDEVLDHIMKFLVESLKATDCSVFVYEEEGEKKYFLKQEVNRMSEIEKAVAKKAIEDEKPVIVKDISLRFNVEAPSGYNSILSIPLKLREKVIGTINIYGGSVSDEGLNFISVMANQVAIAVSNAQRYGVVKELAVVDKLTNVFNRRHFTEILDKALEEEISFDNSIGLVLLDVDNFGKYNNAHGHPKGDELLKQLSFIIQENLREEDSVGRYGGEEFIILLPKASPQSALDVAERIRTAVSNFEFYGRESQPNGKVTVSAGLVVCKTNLSAKQLIKEADEALYKAKNSGRDRVVQRIIMKDNLRAEI